MIGKQSKIGLNRISAAFFVKKIKKFCFLGEKPRIWLQFGYGLSAIIAILE